MRSLGLLALVVLASCGATSGDDHVDAGAPSPIGTGARIREIGDPSRSDHPKNLANVSVTGAAVVWVDTFDETGNGKSRGTVYVQDVGSQEAFSGISLYSPTFIPGDLRVAPGDVLDLAGQYQENDHIGTAIFPAGQVLPQISKPISTFRYEFQPPDPKEVDVNELDDYAKGRKWLGMLVTVKNVTLTDDLDDEGLKKQSAPTGRVTAHLTSNRGGAKMTNELYALPGGTLKAGSRISSLTGIVTYFYELHIAPRSAADVVQ